MFVHHRSLRFVSALIILTLVFSGFPLSSASAQGKDGLKRQFNTQTGQVSFISPESERLVSAFRVLGIDSFAPLADPGMALATRFGPEFGLQDPARDLTELKTDRSEDGRLAVRYQQTYQGIPVLGGELIVNTNENGDLYSMNGEISSDLSLPTQPTIDAEQAKQAALQVMARWYEKAPEDFVSSEPDLWIYHEGLLRPSTRPAELVWRMEVTAVDHSLPVRELILVNAERGQISLHFNQIDTTWRETQKGVSVSNTSRESLPSSEGSTALLFAPLVSTYTAGNGTSLPGAFLCNQADPTCAAGDLHARAAHQYAIGTYNSYATQHSRDSIDNHGMTIISSVHYSTNYANAFWSGSQMVYGDRHGFPLADDVVAHELTHGVTQYESNLYYYYQSGAINESFSDLWGEYYDQTNSPGNDGASVKWHIGEDISVLGALRQASATWWGIQLETHRSQVGKRTMLTVARDMTRLSTVWVISTGMGRPRLLSSGLPRAPGTSGVSVLFPLGRQVTSRWWQTTMGMGRRILRCSVLPRAPGTSGVWVTSSLAQSVISPSSR